MRYCGNLGARSRETGPSTGHACRVQLSSKRAVLANMSTGRAAQNEQAVVCQPSLPAFRTQGVSPCAGIAALAGSGCSQLPPVLLGFCRTASAHSASLVLAALGVNSESKTGKPQGTRVPSVLTSLGPQVWPERQTSLLPMTLRRSGTAA